MTESELLIKIKTALEAGGLDAAKQKVNELVSAHQQAAGSGAAAGLAQGKLNSTLQNAARIAGVARTSFSNLNSVGNGLHTTSMALAGSFSKLVPWLSALSIAWNVAMAIKALVGHLSDTSKEADKAGKSADDLKGKLEELEQAKLTHLYETIDGVISRFDDASAAADRLFSQMERLEDAKLAETIARIKASDLPEGEKQRQIADAEFQHEQDSLSREKKYLGDVASSREAKIRSLERQGADLTTDRDAKLRDVLGVMETLLKEKLVTPEEYARGDATKAEQRRLKAFGAVSRPPEQIPELGGMDAESEADRLKREAEAKRLADLAAATDALPKMMAEAKAAEEAVRTKLPDINREIERARIENEDALSRAETLPPRRRTAEYIRSAAHGGAQDRNLEEQTRERARREQEREALEKERERAVKGRQPQITAEQGAVAREEEDVQGAQAAYAAAKSRTKGGLAGPAELRELLAEIARQQQELEDAVVTASHGLAAHETRMQEIDGQLRNLNL